MAIYNCGSTQTIEPDVTSNPPARILMCPDIKKLLWIIIFGLVILIILELKEK